MTAYIYVFFFSCLGTNSARTDPQSQGPTKCLKIHRVLRIKTGYTYKSTLHKEGGGEEEVQSSPPVTIKQLGRKLELKSAHS